MNWSFGIGRIFGISVNIHWTFVMLLGWVFASELAAGHNPLMAFEGVMFIVTLFGCVVLHELGHALTARKFGIKTRDITLLPIGGVARLERMPERPIQEFWVAVAGPAVNVVIAACLFMLLGVAVGVESVFTAPVLTESFVGRLLIVNIALVVFNMLPAFPMDGGRVYRALLATRYDYVTATEKAARLGKFMAVGFGVLGFLTNGFLVFIALFVYFGAHQEASQVRMKATMRGVPVSEAMVRHFHTLHDDDSLGTAAGELLAGDQHDFPVTAAGEFVGVLTRQDLLSAINAGQLSMPVGQVMHRNCRTVRDTDMLESVVTAMTDQQCQATPVMRNGNIIGVVNLENIQEWLAIQSALGTVGQDYQHRKFSSAR
jgi:Zn-dependent protease/predicted transcriptional regulator